MEKYEKDYQKLQEPSGLFKDEDGTLKAYIIDGELAQIEISFPHSGCAHIEEPCQLTFENLLEIQELLDEANVLQGI